MTSAKKLSEGTCSESVDSSTYFVDSFKEATSELLRRFLRKIEFKNFKTKHYSEIYNEDPELLKETYEQFSRQLENSIKIDLDELCNDQDIYEKLKTLDDLNKESKISEDVKAWRPSGNPNEDVRDYRCICKSAHKKALNALLENVRSQNDQLEKEVMANHEEIIMLKEAVTKQAEENKADLNILEEVDFNMIENLNQMVDD
ncbi:polyamine-modulated factor 1 [Parasteatoda tepidariorum]|uniref:polyamine-modulated factor 1 n=1 Tax=Parasteatoda tepidariorum TaxID=114398 RepID=UPI00077F94F8|nr:uncharacterized protein LOC107437488 [Parasteatoda tepidariorum]